MPTLARQLAEYAHDLAYESLGEAAVHEVKRRVLDSIGCAYGAFNGEVAGIARRVAAAAPVTGGATLWGTGERVLPELAAFANGAMVRYLDCNDTYLSLEPAHPSDNIPAVIAAGETAGADGRAVIAAIALAYEVQCRFCDAASIRARGWDHVTYGAFSSTLGAGRVMGLSVDQLEQAVALAGVNSAAVRQTRVGQLSMWKGCAFANAARQGVFAARLAQAGMTGPHEIFEGPMGFWKQVSGPFPLAVDHFGGPGRPFMILATSIKYWPAEYHAQSAIAAALDLRPELLAEPSILSTPSTPPEHLNTRTPEHPISTLIESIEIHSFDAAVDIIGGEPEKWRPTSRETADHSLPYCVAAALVDGEITRAQFSDERIRDPELLALMDRTAILRDPALTARYPEGIPNRLEVKTTDGRILVREVTYPRGHARNPMTDAEVERKFTAWTEGVIPPDQARRVAELVWRLDELSDLTELIAALTVPGR